MSRPHVDFIDAPAVPLLPVDSGPLAGSAQRLLSQDTGSGAFTALATWPAGFSAELARLGSLLELFVVRGAVIANGRAAPEGSYVRIPAGTVAATVTATVGCDVLVLAEGPLEPATLGAGRDASGNAGGAPGGAPGGELLLIESEQLPWIGEAWEGCLPGFALKALWTDESAGPTLLLVGNVPRFGSGPEFHECPEELFVLEGDWTSRRGLMGKWGYFWRPELITHGPYRSETGSLCLVRGHGHLVANWIDDPDATPEQNRAWIEARRAAAPPEAPRPGAPRPGATP